MAAPVPLRSDYNAAALRRLARSSHDPGQVRRLLALAAVYDGEPRSAAAAVDGVGLQTVRDWVLRFTDVGPAGLLTGKAPGPQPRLAEHHRAALRQVVEAGPIPAVHGVVRWRIELLRVFRQLYSGGLRRLVIGARCDHRVEGDEELPSRGDKGRFDRLSGGLKPRPKILECRAPSRGVHGGDVEH